MKNERSKVGLVAEIAIAAVAVIMLVGINTWFTACGPKDDGSWMACHWAGQMIKGLAAVSVVLAAVHFAARDDKVKMGIDLSLILIALLSALTPGRIISLCMEDMRCRTHTQPWTIGLSVVMLIAACVDAMLRYRAADSSAHRRAVSESA